MIKRNLTKRTVAKTTSGRQRQYQAEHKYRLDFLDLKALRVIAANEDAVRFSCWAAIERGKYLLRLSLDPHTSDDHLDYILSSKFGRDSSFPAGYAAVNMAEALNHTLVMAKEGWRVAMTNKETALAAGSTKRHYAIAKACDLVATGYAMLAEGVIAQHHMTFDLANSQLPDLSWIKRDASTAHEEVEGGENELLYIEVDDYQTEEDEE